jgi:hypothetical protein
MFPKTGASANPHGRPLAGATLSDAYRRLLEIPIEQLPTYKAKLVKEEIALQMILKATKGEYVATREITDRTEGKPEQKQILVGEEGAPGILIEFSSNGQGKIQPDAKTEPGNGDNAGASA